jgi:hypothetical protein
VYGIGAVFWTLISEPDFSFSQLQARDNIGDERTSKNGATLRWKALTKIRAYSNERGGPSIFGHTAV